MRYPGSSGGGSSLTGIIGAIGDAFSSTGSKPTPAWQRPGAGHVPVDWRNPASSPRPVQGPGLGHHGDVWRPKPKPGPKPKPRPIQGPGLGHHGDYWRPKPAGGTRGASSSGSRSPSAEGLSNGASRVVRRPATFTDGNGVVRRVRRSSTRTPAGPKVDPLEKLVDDMLAGSTLPYQNDKKALVEQSAGNVDQLNRLHDFYDGQVGAIRDDANVDFGSMLQRAAELKGISADTIAKNQEWLRSLSAPGAGGTGQSQMDAAAAQTSSAVAGANDSLARDLQGQGRSLNDAMAQIQVAGRAAQRDAVQREMLARQAGEREIDRDITEIRAKRPEMLYELRDQQMLRTIQQGAAEANNWLDQAKLQSLDSYRQGQLALGADRNAIAAARLQSGNRANPSIYGNLPKRYQGPVLDVYKALHPKDNVSTKDVDESIVANPWRAAFERLTEQAHLNPNAAAALATRWFSESLGPDKTNPFNLMTMFRNRGVAPGQQRRIIDGIYGRGTYDQHRRNPAGALVGGMF